MFSAGNMLRQWNSLHMYAETMELTEHVCSLLEISWDNGIHCTHMFSVGSCAGISSVTWPRQFWCPLPAASAPLPSLGEWFMWKAPNHSPGTKLIRAPSPFLYIHALDSEIHHALAAVWNGKVISSPESQVIASSACACLYLCQARGCAQTPLKRVLMAFVYCIPKKSGASPLPLPYFAHSERKQKQNKSCIYSTVPVVQLFHRENLIYPPIVWATTKSPSSMSKLRKQVSFLRDWCDICVGCFLPCSTDCLCRCTSENCGFPAGGRTVATHLYCPPLEQHIQFVFHPSMPANTFPIIAALSDAL